METVCQPSYPLNSENASPFGTFTVYLSCAARAMLPETASDTAMITTAGIPLLFISTPLLFAGHHSNVRDREHIDCRRAPRRRLVSRSTGSKGFGSDHGDRDVDVGACESHRP